MAGILYGLWSDKTSLKLRKWWTKLNQFDGHIGTAAEEPADFQNDQDSSEYKSRGF